MGQRLNMLVVVCCSLVATGCTQTNIDFGCELPGKATVSVGDKEYDLPATIPFDGTRKKLHMELPTPSGRTLKAKGEITFFDYNPTDVDRYARLRAVLSKDLIVTVEDGGAAVFTGYSASKQEVFRLIFGKE